MLSVIILNSVFFSSSDSPSSFALSSYVLGNLWSSQNDDISGPRITFNVFCITSISLLFLTIVSRCLTIDGCSQVHAQTHIYIKCIGILYPWMNSHRRLYILHTIRIYYAMCISSLMLAKS